MVTPIFYGDPLGASLVDFPSFSCLMGGLGGSLTVTGYSSLVISFACSTVVFLSVPVLASSAVSPSPYGYGRASGTGSHAHRHLLPVGAFAFFNVSVCRLGITLVLPGGWPSVTLALLLWHADGYCRVIHVLAVRWGFPLGTVASIW